MFIGMASDPVYREGGPGLSIRRMLVRRRNGPIAVDSPPGEGTAFTLRPPEAA